MTIVANEPLRVPHIGPGAARVVAAPHDAWRSDTDARKRAYAKRRGLDVSDIQTPEQLDQALEKVVGDPDFLPGRWIRRARAAAEAVGRIKRADGQFGTGFLVSPWLLMTNHHVLEDADIAAGATVTFRYEEDDNDEVEGTVRMSLHPERCFVTSPVDQLDMTLVAVEAAEDGTAPGDTFGCIPAHGATGKALVGQPMNIVQHPGGRPRQIAIRNNLLLALDDATLLTYSTDTLPGSSGAPVLSDGWELVALHHSSRTTEGVVANIGIRASAIAAHVKAVTMDADAIAAAGVDAGALLDEFVRRGQTPG